MQVQELAQLFVCGDVQALHAHAAWTGTSREAVLRHLLACLPSSTVVPPARLQTLLSQALEHQMKTCVKYNGAAAWTNLLEDCVADDELVPTLTRLFLDVHDIYMCMYILYMCIYTHIYIYMCVCLYTYMYVYVWIYIGADADASVARRARGRGLASCVFALRRLPCVGIKGPLRHDLVAPLAAARQAPPQRPH